MIETLNELVKTAGVERMNLSIQSTSDARVAVEIQSILGPEPKEASDDQKALRKALSTPILVEGITGEVDAKLDSLLTDYVRSVKPHADSLETNVEKAKQDVASASKTAKTKKAGKSESNVSAEETPAESADDFATNEAYSL